MTTKILSLDELDAIYEIEHDWLFEKLLGKLNANRHLILSADQGLEVQEYLGELGFQLTEKNPDIHVCYMDIKQAGSTNSFLELFVAALSHKFPEVISHDETESNSMDMLRLPALIAKRKKIRVAVFLANSHMFHRFRDQIPFLRTLRLKLKNQKNCIFCLTGINTPYFRDLVKEPGPLSGLGQLFELKHNPLKHRSASIRRLFHDRDKNIGYDTSVYMSCVVDNHPFYLKLLAWHSLIRTHNNCSKAIVEEALNDLIHHFSDRFNKIVESLTTKQLSFLKALVEGNMKLSSKATRDEYQLGSTSNIARIKQSLERKEIINTRNINIVFTDPIFREWLLRYYSG